MSLLETVAAVVRTPSIRPGLRRGTIFGGAAVMVMVASAIGSNLCPWEMRSQIFFTLPFALAFATVLCDCAEHGSAALIARVGTAVVVSSLFVVFGHVLPSVSDTASDTALMNVSTVFFASAVALLLAGATAWDGPFQWRPLRLASIAPTLAGFAILPVVVLGLFAWITTGGTLPIPRPLVQFFDWRVGDQLLRLRPFFSSWMLPGAGIIAVALGRRYGPRVGLVTSDILIGLSILGWGYRFVGVTAIFGLILLDAFGTVGTLHVRKRALLWVSLLILCTLPFDVSLYDSVAAPKWTPATSGLWTGSAYEYVERGDIYIVGSCVPFYLEPRWMWTW